MPTRRAGGHRPNYPANKTSPKRLRPVISAADTGSAASSAVRGRCRPGDHRSPLPLANVRKCEPSSPLARLDEAVAGTGQSFGRGYRDSLERRGDVVQHGVGISWLLLLIQILCQNVSGRIISQHVTKAAWGAVVPYQTQCPDQETYFIWAFRFLQDGHSRESRTKRQKPTFLLPQGKTFNFQ